MASAQEFWEALHGRRVALVYSYPKAKEPSDRWYDRWKTRVIMSYGEALERIGIFPFYCDVDTFCEKAFSASLPEIDAAFSLNAGVRPVSHFALVPAVAQWCEIPIIPCTADVIMAGERKDLGNNLAAQTKIRVPKVFNCSQIDEAKREDWLIVKPRDLGGSFGLKRIPGTTLRLEDFDFARIVQRFVRGYDVTIPVFLDAQIGQLVVGDATVYVPSNSNPTDWIYDRGAKEAYVGGGDLTEISRTQIPLDKDACTAIHDFAIMLGVDCFARIDFRLEADLLQGVDCISLDQLSFIEVNPMPTVCTGLAFVESIRSLLSRKITSKLGALGPNLCLNDDYDLIAYVLANSLVGQLGPTKMNDRNQIGS